MVTLLHVVALGEARELLSVLRRNRRFGYFLSFAASSQPSEHPFVKEIKLLRDIILENSSGPGKSAGEPKASRLFSEADLRRVLEPFLHVITSRDASGVITGVALLCVDRIIASLFHTISSTGDANLWAEYAPTLSMVINAVSACRFDPTDPAADEVVLNRITSAVVRIATSPAVPHLSDASMIRGIEACLGIASGRKRASELLRRTAESALCEIVSSLGISAAHCAASGGEQPVMDVFRGSTTPDGVVANGNDAAGSHSFNAEAFEENGPLSGAVLTAILLVACKMTEPQTASSPAETVLGLQIMSSILTFGSHYLVRLPTVKDVLLRDCCRSTLRCVGSFRSPLSVISGAFTVSCLLVHVLGSEATALLCTLLGDVYPCYISGLENVKTVGSENNGGKNNVPKLNHSSSGLSLNLQGAGKPGDGGNGMGNQLDPVVREVGLESLADLLSSPGLLSSLYEAADCDLKSSNVVGPLLLALGQASHSSRPRRRSKRLRASSSGSTRMSAGVANADSDDEDNVVMTGGNPDSIRFARAAALLCAEAVLTVVHTMKERLDLRDEIAMGLDSAAVATRLTKRAMKLEKNRLEEAADAFNSNSKINKAEKLAVFLRDLKYAPKSTANNVQADVEHDVATCAKFLRETPGLDKTMIGAILGEPDDMSRRVLEAFTGSFDFYNQPFTDSLRVFLGSFRLPGESQKIDRIMESFSNAFFGVNQAEADEANEANANGKDASASPVRNGDEGANTSSPSSSVEKTTIGLLRNSDAVYTLSFAVIMLNTDLHNASIRRKMNLNDFVRNLRGSNDGEDFPRWFLTEIFDAIKSFEIKMKDEVGMEAMTTAHWDEILKDIVVRDRLLADGTLGPNFDEDIFSLCWQSAVAAASVTLIEAGDANQAQKALEGFVSVAQCAKAFRQSEPVDVVVSALVSSTNILDGPLLGAVFRFGTDIKAQMGAVTLADIARHCEDWMRSGGWQALITYALRLHALCLLPKELETSLSNNGTDLEVNGKPLADSLLLPAWWPSQTDKKQIREADTDDLPKKQSKAKGFFGALFAASVGSDVSSDEESDSVEGDSQANGYKPIRVSHSSPVYLRLRSTEQIEAQKLARKCIARCRLEDVFLNETEALQSDSLHCMSRAIARAAGRILDATGSYPESSVEEMEGGQDPVSPSVRPNGVCHSPSKGTTGEFSPPSPTVDSSAIVGVSGAVLADSLSVEMEGEFRGYRNRTWTGSLRTRDERKAREFVVAFCIDALCDLTLQNEDRLHISWPALHSILVRIISPATPPCALLERSIIALLRVAARLLDRDELRDDVLRTLNLVVRLPGDATLALSGPIAAGLYNLVKCHGSQITSTSGWHAIFSIIENLARCPPPAVDIGLKLLSLVLSEKSSVRALCPETFSPLLDAVMAFVTQSSVSGSLQALDLLYSLSQRIPKMVINIKNTEEGNETGQDGTYWVEFWGPLLKGFSQAARNPRGKVRNHALVALEKVIALLGASDYLTASQWKVALSTVIFPLMKQLFSTHGFFEASVEAERAAQRKLRLVRSNSTGGRARSRSDFVSAEHDEQLVRSVLAACGKTRLRAVMLTSKTFLQHHAVIAAGLPAEEFTDLWLGVLEVFRLALQGDPDDSSEIVSYARDSEVDELQEHVPESVKNMLLVMCDCGLLSADDSVRWNATFNLIRTFLPDTAEDIEALAAAPVPENTSPEPKNSPAEPEASPAEPVNTS